MPYRLPSMLIASLILLLGTGIAHGQGDTVELYSAVQVTLVPPVSTNGRAFAEYTNLLSLNMLVGVSQHERGVVLGGLANITLRNARGLQLAGLCNYVGGHTRGAQIAGLVNITRESTTGMQLAGLTNIGDSIHEAPLMGLVNVARVVHGGQLLGAINVAGDAERSLFAGLVNVAGKVERGQLVGLVNVADSCDAPVGLLNLVRNGDYSIAATYDETGSTLLSLRTGKRSYGILGVGFNHQIRGGALVAVTGIGARSHLARWIGFHHEFTGGILLPTSPRDVGFKTSYTLMLAAHWGHLTLLAGPSINHMHMGGETHRLRRAGWALYQQHSERHWWRVHMGYTVGVQYTL